MKHKAVIDRMTLEEKAAFLSGKNIWETRDFKRLDIRSVFCADGPHGIRKQAGTGDHLGLNESLPATCFPTAATVANSWDEELACRIGEALGTEAAAARVDVLLGPGINIKRSPLCGRNFEYFSEDPYLSGKLAAAYIRGIQSKGVFACPKHFAVNSQELRRMSMNAVIDERTLREIYLTGFEIAVKEGAAGAIMTSYNEVNGVYANENKHLLRDILRQEWGFDGIVITDWGGSNDHVKGVAAGSNLEMPSPGLDSARELISAIEEGTLTEAELDSCVDDLLEAVLRLGKERKEKSCIDEQKHHELARKAAAESTVLLKNQEQILPLSKNTKVVLIGDFAFEPRYQGAGSSMVNPYQVESAENVIGKYELQVIGIARGYKRNHEEDALMRDEAVKLAAEADVVLYFFGLDESSEAEGMDRNHMRIPQNQIDLLEKLIQVNTNLVGVLSAGAAVEMPWHYCCKAILHTYLGGQAGASAVFDILTGKVNPSGRLTESYPYRYEDTPAFRYFPSAERNSEYRESVYVGYRYYETSRVRTLYPFGYGLSYTCFKYSELTADEKAVSFTLTNTGDVDGAEVAQLYVSLPKTNIFRAEKELKGFAKIFLRAGESRRLSIPFDDKTFRYWNVKTNRWETEEGSYQLKIGSSAADIKLETEIYIAGTTSNYPYNINKMPHYESGLIQHVEDREFEALLGQKIPDGGWSGELSVNDSVCQMYYAKSRLARFIYRLLTALKKRSEKKGRPDLNILFIYNIPFRGIAKMTGGIVSMEMVHGMVLAVNGRLFRGIKQLVGGFFSNRKANRIYEKKLSREGRF